MKGYGNGYNLLNSEKVLKHQTAMSYDRVFIQCADAAFIEVGIMSRELSLCHRLLFR